MRLATISTAVGLTLLISGCGLFGGGISPPPNPSSDPWTLPPEPVISPVAKGDSVCMTQQEMINLTTYVDRLRRKSIEHGGVDPEIQ